MERREEFGTILFDEMKKCLQETKQLREGMLEGKADELGLADEDELKSEVEFIVQTLNLLNCIWPPIRKTRATIISNEEVDKIERNIMLLKQHWSCQRPWEDKPKNITPKFHLLYFHIVKKLRKYGRICHMAEDPIERTHAEDKYLERNFVHQRDDIKREESKTKVRQFKRHPEVRNIIDSRKKKRTRSLREVTVKAKKIKTEEQQLVKIESRNGTEFAIL